MSTFQVLEKLIGMFAIVTGSILLCLISEQINVPTKDITLAHVLAVLPFFSILCAGGILVTKD